MAERTGYGRLLGEIFKQAYHDDKAWIKARFTEWKKDKEWLSSQDEWLKRQLYTALLDEMDQWPIPMSEARKKRIEILEKMKAKYRRFKGLE